MRGIGKGVLKESEGVTTGERGVIAAPQKEGPF